MSCYCSQTYLLEPIIYPRVKSLRTQVAELETEAELLTNALDVQKATILQTEATARKKSEELSKDIQNKTLEITQLKTRLKQYQDYDEIKRELEIMKVREYLLLLFYLTSY